jgi:hypothetical protein
LKDCPNSSLFSILAHVKPLFINVHSVHQIHEPWTPKVDSSPDDNSDADAMSVAEL